MTVEKLKKELEKYPDHMEVYLTTNREDDFFYGPIETVKRKEIDLSEDPDGEALCQEDCLVLSDTND